MNYTNYIYGGVSVGLIFVLGFYFSKRRRSRRASEDPSTTTITKAEGADAQNHDSSRRGSWFQKRRSSAEPTLSTSTTASSHLNHVNGGIRKRGDHTNNNNNNNNSDASQSQNIKPPTSTPQSDEQGALILQNFYKSPLTPHKRLSTIHQHSNNNSDKKVDNDNATARHFNLDVKTWSDVSNDNTTKSQLIDHQEEKEKKLQSGCSVDDNTIIKDVETVQQQQQQQQQKESSNEIATEEDQQKADEIKDLQDLNSEKVCVKENQDKDEDVMMNDNISHNRFESVTPIETSMKADQVFATTKIEEENIQVLKDEAQLPCISTIENNKEGIQLENGIIPSLADQEKDNLLDVNENVVILSSTSDIQPVAVDVLNKTGDADANLGDHKNVVNDSSNVVNKISTPSPPKLSKFKLFVFQQYADRVSDSILIRTSDTLGRFQDSQFDYADDLMLSILYEAQRELSSKVKTRDFFKKEDNTALDLLADELVKEIIDKINTSDFDQVAKNDANISEEATLKPKLEEQHAVAEDKLEDIQRSDLLEKPIRHDSVERTNLYVHVKDNKTHQEVDKTVDDDEADGGVSTDYGRPLSGYAKNLADFLAEDDDEFELTDSEDEEDDTNDNNLCQKNTITDLPAVESGNAYEYGDINVDSSSEVEDDDEILENDQSINNQNSKTNELTSESFTCQSDNSHLNTDKDLLIKDSTNDHHESLDKEACSNENRKTVESFVKDASSANPDETLTKSDAEPKIAPESKNKHSNNKNSKESQFSAPAKRRQNKNRRARGERPKSLYEQDLQEMLPDINKYVEEQEQDVCNGDDDEDEEKGKLNFYSLVIFLIRIKDLER